LANDTCTASVLDDREGRFDFGPLGTGHYTLEIDGKDWFDVEIKVLPQVTESVTIDVSPVFPDCTEGHEFVVKLSDERVGTTMACSSAGLEF
jgi:hypothetical protein